MVFIAILELIVNIFTTHMKDTFISSEGCIGRLAYILRLVLLLALPTFVTIQAISYFDHWHHGIYSPLGPFIGIIVGLICLLVGLMQMLKRLRDMGKPAYWTLFMLIPGINVLVLIYTVLARSKS